MDLNEFFYNEYLKWLCICVPYRPRSKEKDNVEPVSEKKKLKEEKEDEKVEDVGVPSSDRVEISHKMSLNCT